MLMVGAFGTLIGLLLWNVPEPSIPPLVGFFVGGVLMMVFLKIPPSTTLLHSLKEGEPRFVSIESPFHSEDEDIIRRNICYAIQATKHAAIEHNEIGYPSHLIYTQLANGGNHYYVGDHIEDKWGVGRDKTIAFTNNLRQRADYIVLYTDFGISRGMQFAIDAAEAKGLEVVERRLPPEYMDDVLVEHKNKH